MHEVGNPCFVWHCAQPPLPAQANQGWELIVCLADRARAARPHASDGGDLRPCVGLREISAWRLQPDILSYGLGAAALAWEGPPPALLTGGSRPGRGAGASVLACAVAGSHEARQPKVQWQSGSVAQMGNVLKPADCQEAPSVAFEGAEEHARCGAADGAAAAR